MSIYKAKYQTIKQLIILFTFAFIFFLPIKASAESLNQSITVSPIIEDLKLVPGNKLSYQMTIKNNSDSPIGIKLSPSYLDPDNLASTQNNSRSLVPFITISEENFILDPKHSKEITVTLSPPKNLKNGGYYATLTIIPFITGQSTAGTPVILTRIISVILSNVGDINYNNLASKTNIDNFFVKKNFTNKPLLAFNIGNNYFSHFTAKPFLTIKPLIGPSKNIQLEEKHILPGKKRSWEYEFSGIPMNSIFYTAFLSVSVGEGHSISKQIVFILLPAQIILLIAMLLLAVFIILLRGRFKRAILELVGKKR